MTIAQVETKQRTVTVHVADCEECGWTGPDREFKSRARIDQVNHNREFHK